MQQQKEGDERMKPEDRDFLDGFAQGAWVSRPIYRHPFTQGIVGEDILYVTSEYVRGIKAAYLSAWGF